MGERFRPGIGARALWPYRYSPTLRGAANLRSKSRTAVRCFRFDVTNCKLVIWTHYRTTRTTLL